MSAAWRLPLREKTVCALLLLCVSLASLMNLGGLHTSEHELVLVVLFVGLILALPGGRLRTTPGRFMVVCAFVACTVVAYLRFAAAPIAPFSGRILTGLALMLMIVTAFALCALLAPADAITRRRRMLCALFSPVCFAALDLVLYIVGFHFPAAQSEIKGNNGSAQLLGLIGIHSPRVSLPLNPGLNGTGESAALVLVICAVLAYRSRGSLRWISGLGVLVGLVSVLLTDSRGPLAYALAAVLILILLPRWAKRVVAAVPILLPLAPAIILYVVGHLGSVGETLNRGQGNGSFVTATGRSKIWSIVVEFLSHPHAEDLIGYGAYGQVRSGVSSHYAYIFRYQEHPEFNSTHNIAFQTILEMGYIGLGLYLLFLVMAVNSARISHQRANTPESAALLGALIALSLFGASEALPGLAGGIPLLVSLILLTCIAIRGPASTLSGMKSGARLVAPDLARGSSPTSTAPQALVR
jgi:O-antigen ligase